MIQYANVNLIDDLIDYVYEQSSGAEGKAVEHKIMCSIISNFMF